MREGPLMVSKGVSKGCPQGSVLGPKLWNLVFDGLLERITSNGFTVLAYADDAAVILRGPSRSSLEAEGARVARILEDWSLTSKLEFAPLKCETMMMRGKKVGYRTQNLDSGRPAVVRLGGQRLTPVREVKYLGVCLGAGLTLRSHIHKTSQRAAQALSKRAALIKCAKAYRTVASSGIPVACGVLPADLEAARRAKLHQLGLCESGTCTCGDASETAEHVLRGCTKWTPQRRTLEEKVYGNEPPDDLTLYVSKVGFPALVDFARQVLARD
ncbi:hypothetical protein GE061_000081 [Apolygus lucorum]|uniref:Reverse transcriptase domain-containing protein n=1 Tax=Apolygus lucorum TaxID=248454 RepID=A0A8S9Y5A4_APOLU|nr:hypothetical protein GE061_000081 [Apolygus lucorum]